MYIHGDHIDAPIAPAHEAALIRDRRRPGRIHDVSPELIPLLRTSSEVRVGDDIVPVPGGIESALRGTRPYWGWLRVWHWASLGIAISTVATAWFVTGHGSWIILAVGKLLSFSYAIGLVM
jgi:hypothetical protein